MRTSCVLHAALEAGEDVFACAPDCVTWGADDGEAVSAPSSVKETTFDAGRDVSFTSSAVLVVVGAAVAVEVTVVVGAVGVGLAVEEADEDDDAEPPLMVNSGLALPESPNRTTM